MIEHLQNIKKVEYKDRARIVPVRVSPRIAQKIQEVRQKIAEEKIQKQNTTTANVTGAAPQIVKKKDCGCSKPSAR